MSTNHAAKYNGESQNQQRDNHSHVRHKNRSLEVALKTLG